MDRVELESHPRKALARASRVEIAVEERVGNEQHARHARAKNLFNRRRAMIQVAAAVQGRVADQKQAHAIALGVYGSAYVTNVSVATIATYCLPLLDV
jgi:hypothetical protein